jgi:hypothetical protein
MGLVTRGSDVGTAHVRPAKGNTYNLAFFFGPGLPLGLGSPSGPNEGPALLLTPFFFTPSVGGGMDEGTGVPLAAGVLTFDSDGLSPFELGATGGGFEIDDDDSFDGDSSLTSVAGSNLCRALGGSLKVKIKLLFEDFRRPAEGIAGLLDEDIAELMVEMWFEAQEVGRRGATESVRWQLKRSLRKGFLHNHTAYV